VATEIVLRVGTPFRIFHWKDSLFGQVREDGAISNCFSFVCADTLPVGEKEQLVGGLIGPQGRRRVHLVLNKTLGTAPPDWY